MEWKVENVCGREKGQYWNYQGDRNGNLSKERLFSLEWKYSNTDKYIV